MPNWHLVKPESLTLVKSKSLEFAATHNGLPKSPVEREVDPKRVAKLAAILRKGLVLPFCWATVEYEGQLVRMNGQHSSAAILEVGAEIPEHLSFHMDRYKADDRIGLVDLFRQFDQRWSSRSVQDISGAYQGTVAEIADLNRKITMQAARGLSWLLRTVEGIDAPSGDDTFSLLHNSVYSPFIVWANGIVNARKELMKPQILAAMYKTYERSQSGSTHFWREVSFGLEYFTDDNLPGAVLIGELNKALEDKEFRAKEFSQEPTYYKKAIKAWNAFCAGQRISTLKVGREKGWPEAAHYREDTEAA